jgi:arsenite transporter
MLPMDDCRDNRKGKGIGFFERYLTVWVILCIAAGITLGKLAPGIAQSLDAMAIYVDDAPVVSIPIALCLFFMMYPIMVKIDFASVVKAGKSGKPVLLTLFINWAVKPFTMYGISMLFLGVLFRGFIGEEATDLVRMPFGLDLPVGAIHGAGTVVLHEGVRMLEIPLWRSYLAGTILLGIAPCTAMVLVWSFLSRGNDGLTLVMVAINSLTMLLLYGVLGGFLLGVGQLPIPWQALLSSIGIYVALPLVAGFLSRRWLIAAKGEQWFKERFLQFLTPITIIALLTTLVLLFSFKGEVILRNPLTILWIAVPLFIQTVLIFALGYALSRALKLRYEDAAPAAMIGASNHFEVAIATATMLFGLSSGAALATVVGVLIEVPVMLMLVRFCLETSHWFGGERGSEAEAEATDALPTTGSAVKGEPAPIMNKGALGGKGSTQP